MKKNSPLSDFIAKIEFKNLCIFDSPKDEELVVEACIEYLQKLNYRVLSKPNYNTTVSNLDELLTLFYNTLEYYHTDIYALGRNIEKDKAILSSFLVDRQSFLYYSYKDTIKECVDIIKHLFLFEKDLNITVPLGIWVFSKNNRWIIDKVIVMMNNYVKNLNDRLVDAMVIKDEHKSDDYKGFDFNRLRRIHGE